MTRRQLVWFLSNYGLLVAIGVKDSMGQGFHRHNPPELHEDFTPRPERSACDPESHWVVRQPERSLHFPLEEDQDPLCDDHLRPGWYRFDSPAGGLVPTTCPGRNFCSTKAPIWMNGSIPGVEEGVVETTACITLRDDCCGVQLPLLVQNCSKYVVYQIHPPSGCPAAFCAGTEVPCPPGLSSKNGFTPCHFTVEVAEAKVAFGTPSEEKEAVAFCDVVLEGVVLPDTVLLEIEWLVDGDFLQEDIFPLLERLRGTLPQSKWRVGQALQCIARARHLTINTFTKPVTSEPLQTGVHVLSPPVITIKEGGPPGFWEFVPVIPLTCPKKEKPKSKDDKEEKEEEKDEPCCVLLKLQLTSLSEDSVCANGEPNEQAVVVDCEYPVCSEDWNRTQKVAIWARPDGVLTGHTRAEIGAVVAKGDALGWKGYVLPPQEVEIKTDDVAETCGSDTHVRTFDGIYYPVPSDGAYVLYFHAAVAIEVQVHYKKCSYRHSCNCGVAIRFGDVILGVDVCTAGFLQWWTRTEQGGPAHLGDIHPLFRIVRLRDGRAFQVVLPTGTTVDLGPLLSYIRIAASARDLGQTRGLCGTLTRRVEDEFFGRNGTSLCSPDSERVCDAFLQEWRVGRRRSLFAGVFATRNDPPHDDFLPKCGCEPDEKGSKVQAGPEEGGGEPEIEASCYVSQCVDPRGIVVTAEIIEFVSDEDHEVDLAQFASSIEGVEILPESPHTMARDEWTSMKAERMCWERVQRSTVMEACEDLVPYSRHISKVCSHDVAYSHDAAWVEITLDQLRDACIHRLSTSLSLWRQKRSLLTKLCPTDCKGNGRCVAGGCSCMKGWGGSDCSVDVGKPPHGLKLMSNLCDVRTKPCLSVLVTGSNFASTPRLFCQWEIFTFRFQNTTRTFYGSARTESSLITNRIVVCPIPSLAIHEARTQPFYLPGESLSKTRAALTLHLQYHHGTSSKEDLEMLLYDSLCWVCTGDGCSTRESNDCIFQDDYGGFRGYEPQTFGPDYGYYNPSSSIIRVREEPKKADICLLPIEAGPCKTDTIRYYYDKSESRCRPFVYGGCGGNSNNFEVQEDCLNRCHHLINRDIHDKK